ncbi:MAG: hypothetical protein CMP76_08055 [Flavobacterium sp.]|uniref:hypothetical protein n=1 Tax=Flavobacterium sp. TaxID=239 RepID=UPI000C6222CF|nr:hypothetical protein [Flavobacterium sp.]MBF03234.1 hypothetical protein [Flavobacterium sp.]|tara:strand:+ start:737 stop:1066 length:330 start_codon:yes stop_codon:yes gene_type:complete
MDIHQILNLFLGSTTIVSILIAWKSRKAEIKKIEALSNQEISKSDQEKIATAEKTIELLDKLRERMDKEFEIMSKKIATVEEENKKIKGELDLYKNQCSKCSNNKIGKK